jgi:hypothetical protein
MAGAPGLAAHPVGALTGRDPPQGRETGELGIHEFLNKKLVRAMR